jgi:DNA-binding LacI/PurR family transcriptional regulator
MKEIKLEDIAKAAGVSSATASLALNNKGGVSKDTSKKIITIAKKMGYISPYQSHLQKKRGCIRFIKIVKHGHILNDDHSVFVSSYIEGLEKEATYLGYLVEILYFDQNNINSILQSFNNSPPAGALILATELDAQDIELFQKIKIPLVFMDAYYNFIPENFVDMNNTDSVFKIIKFLHQNGHQDIGIVQGEFVTPNFQIREEGFFNSLNFFKLKFDQSYYYKVKSKFEDVYQGMLEQIDVDKLPSALFCVNDIIALGCIRALKKKGLKIPQDISVVGFDNLPAAEVSSPSLTTIDVSKRQIGQSAMNLLHSKIINCNANSPEKIQIGGHLVIRNSVAAK